MNFPMKLVFTLMIITFSCNYHENKNDQLNVVFNSVFEVELTTDYQILKHSNTASLGDSVETFVLKISKGICDSLLLNKRTVFLPAENNLFYANYKSGENKVISFILDSNKMTLRITIYNN